MVTSYHVGAAGNQNLVHCKSRTFFETGFFTKLRVHQIAKLAGQWATGILLFPLLHHWVYRCEPSCLASLCKFWGSKLMHTQHCPLSHLCSSTVVFVVIVNISSICVTGKIVKPSVSRSWNCVDSSRVFPSLPLQVTCILPVRMILTILGTS